MDCGAVRIFAGVVELRNVGHSPGGVGDLLQESTGRVARLEAVLRAVFAFSFDLLLFLLCDNTRSPRLQLMMRIAETGLVACTRVLHPICAVWCGSAFIWPRMRALSSGKGCSVPHSETM